MELFMLCVHFFCARMSSKFADEYSACTRTCTSLHAHHFITCRCRSKKGTCRNNLNQRANHFVGLSVMQMITKSLVENSSFNN